MFTRKDVCIITPTYNRPTDLERLIRSIIKNNIPGKHIIVDQSKNDKTKNLVKKYMKKYKFIEYIYNEIAGTNIAFNKGIDIAKKENFKIICLIADDVELIPKFLNNVLKEFKENKKVMGIGAVQIDDKPIDYNSLKFRLKTQILNLFLMANSENHKYRITGPYGITGTPYIERDIRDCQWLPGFITCHRKEVFDNYRIPERIGYDVLEDIDMGYYIYIKYGKGSLVIPKKVRAHHHYSQTERFGEIDKKRIFINHEDHFAFYYRYFYNFTGTLKLLWELHWINILNIGRFLMYPKKENLLRLVYLWQALRYCVKNREKIKKGKSRMFLNADLTMKSNL